MPPEKGGDGAHVSKQVMTPPGNAGGAGNTGRGPQSTQSVPYAQCECSEPGPPSLQVLSKAYMHVFKQTGGIEGGAGGGDGGGGARGEMTNEQNRP